MADGEESILGGGTPRREICIRLEEVYLEKRVYSKEDVDVYGGIKYTRESENKTKRGNRRNERVLVAKVVLTSRTRRTYLGIASHWLVRGIRSIRLHRGCRLHIHGGRIRLKSKSCIIIM
jgi:hypothetical protein